MGDRFEAARRGWTAGALTALTLGAVSCDFWNEPRDDDVLRVTHVEETLPFDHASGGVEHADVDATAEVEPARGEEAARGVFSFVREGDGVEVVGSLRGLPADGAVRVTLLEGPNCPSPRGGSPSEGEEIFAGRADDEGAARLKRLVARTSVGDGGPRDLAGRAIVVESGGPAEPKRSCGLIRRAEHG